MTTSETYLDELNALDARMRARFDQNHAPCDQVFRKAFAHLTWTITHVEIHQHRRQITAAALTSRVLQHAHAVHGLIRTGNTPSAEVVMRSMLESIFAVAALARDENFEEGNDLFLRLRYKAEYSDARNIKKFLGSSQTLALSARQVMEQRLLKREAWLKANSQYKMKSVADLAAAADMFDFYEREYALQSKTTHSDLDGVLNAHANFRSGKVALTAVIPSHESAVALTAQVVNALMVTATALANLFDLKYPPEEVGRREDIAQSLDTFFKQATMQ